MASLDIVDSPRDSIEDKRKRCLLGELPDDFLRIPNPNLNPNVNQNNTSVMMYPQHVQVMPPPQYVTTQQLEITIIQARLAKNYGITRMDPYCKVRVGHKTYETVTAFNGSKNPYWNKKFFCPIPKGVDAIHISIFDEKTMSADEEIAFGVITFPHEIFKGNVIDNWYPLTGKQGENLEGQINVVLSIKEVQMMQPPTFPLPVRQMVTPADSNLISATHYNVISPGYVMPTTQPHVRPAPVITDADVDQIHEMFPTIEKKVIKDMLEENGGNKELAISALLTISDDGTQQ